MKSKSPSIRVIRAALARHNNWVSQHVAGVESDLQEEMRKHIQPHLQRLNELLAGVDAIRKELKSAGWGLVFDGFYLDEKKMTVSATMGGSQIQKLIKERKIQLPKKMSEDDMVLALTETGEDDVAKAMDKLKLHWRT